ncbi:MAG: LacI family DNA-binding transcriptional regulator [Vicinamibacteria bacterium]|nr:LacI family DNA-binding transcriptional regulator [Vicinamibacteria bacterium]
MRELKRQCTIHDIARRAGVSPSTVSRVLNQTSPVRPEKRRSVIEAVEALKYRPSIVAQGLARGRSPAVGVLVQDISSPFYSRILLGIEGRLVGTGLYPIFASGVEKRQTAQALQLLNDNRVGSMIVVGGRMFDADIIRMSARMPVVVVGRAIAGMEERCLRVENIEGGCRATRHLLDLGHRRIAHLTGVHNHPDAIDRREGYARALSERGIDVDPALIVTGDFEEISGLRGVEALVSDGVGFSAIFAGNDQMAYGAQLALHRHGLRVPQDVSLVGFDDLPHSTFTVPALTTIRQPTIAIGAAAVDALIGLLQGQPLCLPVFPTELVVRDSTAPFFG